MREPVRWALDVAHELHAETFGDPLAIKPTKTYLDHFDDALPGSMPTRSRNQQTTLKQVVARDGGYCVQPGTEQSGGETDV
jgi:hypothetical protein